ncbi:MAG TPA: glycosyltransferase, partial [Gemmatimonadaceae bacterium]|nr:glycosyltransferase [Gemmatimonadaceae bacterium]
MTALALALVAAPLVLFGYAYVVYPAVLRLLAALRPAAPVGPIADHALAWPFVTVTIPAYNEERTIADAIENVLAAEYPAERREVLVLSDASTDRTDEIVRGYAGRGVHLMRLAERRGKTALENAAGRVARGEIIVNMDAGIRIPPRSLKALVRAFADAGVGVASGRDISVGDERAEGNQAESGYVGYEMGVRALETRLGGIVGASGCFYGIRRAVHDTEFPETLSRDFASALIARARGYRAVSVNEAVCVVPRTTALKTEFRRKVRTMARGLQTLWYERALMNPARYGGFALMLISHKLCRWLAYLTLPGAVVGLMILAADQPAARAVLTLGLVGVILGAIGLRWPGGRRVPAVFALPGFLLASNAAGIAAWIQAL